MGISSFKKLKNLNEYGDKNCKIYKFFTKMFFFNDTPNDIYKKMLVIHFATMSVRR